MKLIQEYLSQFYLYIIPNYQLNLKHGLFLQGYVKKDHGYKLYHRQGGTRTPDTVVRSHILYPTELLVRTQSIAKLT